MQLIDYLAQERGQAASLARAVGVSPTQIGKWVKGDRPIPVKKCVLIEQVTGGVVRRAELRQDWRDVWPELAMGAAAPHTPPPHEPQHGQAV